MDVVLWWVVVVACALEHVGNGVLSVVLLIPADAENTKQLLLSCINKGFEDIPGLQYIEQNTRVHYLKAEQSFKRHCESTKIYQNPHNKYPFSVTITLKYSNIIRILKNNFTKSYQTKSQTIL